MKKIKKAIKNTAKNNKVTVREAKKEISYAISKALENSKGDLKCESFWREFTKNKRQPTPEEFIAAIVEKVLSEECNK